MGKNERSSKASVGKVVGWGQWLGIMGRESPDSPAWLHCSGCQAGKFWDSMEYNLKRVIQYILGKFR